ncbi:hypothetical protein GLV94_12020 [Virgibacillus halodenitrificans]|uniref:hypothetical protein n=2 Tax=Virgibacillus halodenitrificans TaxID=1482 RepID=UPI001369C35A|nr:hypothetical protein [Virgibacillus halodenitrificans]MYL46371.1 hypothetical protein [Virgibacillus halodenitrificans]MYL59343.1 hypothetical protein [Virgibacillus halodenitrificans]
MRGYSKRSYIWKYTKIFIFATAGQSLVHLLYQHQPTADLIGEILTASLITTGLWWLMDMKPSEKKEEFE